MGNEDYYGKICSYGRIPGLLVWETMTRHYYYITRSSSRTCGLIAIQTDTEAEIKPPLSSFMSAYGSAHGSGFPSSQFLNLEFSDLKRGGEARKLVRS